MQLDDDHQQGKSTWREKVLELQPNESWSKCVSLEFLESPKTVMSLLNLISE